MNFFMDYPFVFFTKTARNGGRELIKSNKRKTPHGFGRILFYTGSIPAKAGQQRRDGAAMFCG
jgi:hypothetical protein